MALDSEPAGSISGRKMAEISHSLLSVSGSWSISTDPYGHSRRS